MRPVVRAMSRLHVRLYQLTGGRAQAPRYPTMLLTVTGRRTGQPRTVPLVYVRDGDSLVVSAAYSGSDRDPDWWLNLQRDPHGVAEINGRLLEVRASVVSSHERAPLWERLVAMYPPFADYEKRTARQFAVIRLTPDRPRTSP